MTPEEIAQKYSIRPGYRLLDYMEVGLPVYSVALQASTLLRKKISPLEEFVMRCLKQGMKDCEEISRFLGLDLQVVESIMSGLIQDTNVCLAGVPNTTEQELKLTAKGVRSLTEAETIVPEDKTLSLHFDALLRKPAWYKERLLKYKELREFGLKEIPSASARQPRPSDFPVREIEALLKQSAGAGEKRDLLTIKRVERCNRLFRHALGLLFRGIESGEPVVEFVVDGKITSEYGMAFARADGLKLLGMEATLPSEHQQSVREELQDLIPSSSVLEQEEREVLEVEFDIKKANEQLETVKDDSTRRKLEEQLREAQAKLAEIEAEKKRRRVRQVYVYEHPRLLDRALTSAQSRLLLISPWISAAVVDEDFLKKLRDCLKRGIKVYIGYGITEKANDRKPSRSDIAAEEKLKGLSNRFQNFVFRKLGDTHAKVLICDSKFIVTGSFNWLSFRGDPDRTFRDEQSTLVEIPEHIDDVFREQLKRFELSTPVP